MGLIPEAAVNKDTEADILNWLYKRYHIDGKSTKWQSTEKRCYPQVRGDKEVISGQAV